MTSGIIDQRIHDLSDKELENLHGNAIRLAQAGSPAQKAEAERLLPVIGAEVGRRAHTRSTALREKRAEARAARKKAEVKS